MAGYTTESGPTSVESLTTEATDAANSSAAPPSSADSSVSNISMEPITLANSLNNARGLFKKRSLVQLINRYIKAGIEEGAFFFFFRLVFRPRAVVTRLEFVSETRDRRIDGIMGRNKADKIDAETLKEYRDS